MHVMYKHEESKHPHKIIKYRLERWDVVLLHWFISNPMLQL